MLIFCLVIKPIHGAEYRILEIKQYFVHLFILLVHVPNMEFFKAVHMSAFWGYLYYFLCVLYVSYGCSVFSSCCA
jgi:hypothetical protein